MSRLRKFTVFYKLDSDPIPWGPDDWHKKTVMATNMVDAVSETLRVHYSACRALKVVRGWK